MKNWYRVYDFENADVIVRKNYNDEEKPTIEFIVYDSQNSIEMSQKIAFKTEDARDRAFEDSSRENVQPVVDAITKFMRF